MPEINFTSLKDLNKLEGWLINKCEFIEGEASVRFILSHIASETKLQLVISGTVLNSISKQGPVVMMCAQPALEFRAKDLPNENNVQG